MTSMAEVEILIETKPRSSAAIWENPLQNCDDSVDEYNLE
jgi:hypothetical protein